MMFPNVRVLIAISTVCTTILLGFIFFGSENNLILPLRCYSFTQYDLGGEGQTLKFNVAQDLRLYKDGTGYFLLNGRVLINNEEKNLGRTLILNRGEVRGSNTAHYSISRIIISPTDNTDNPTFEKLLAEFTGDPETLQLDVINVGHHTFMMGSPLSFVFTCVAF